MKLKTKKIVALAILWFYCIGSYALVCWIFPFLFNTSHREYLENVALIHILGISIGFLIYIINWAIKILETKHEEIRFTGKDEYLERNMNFVISKDIKSDGEWHAVARKK